MPFEQALAYLCDVDLDEGAHIPHKKYPRLVPWLNLLRIFAAEFIGTTLLVFFCAASGTAAAQFDLGTSSAAVVLIGAIQGFAVLALVSALAHRSGGHINPAVTAALWVMRQISFLRALGYILAQCAGGLAGAGLLAAALPRSHWRGLGSTVPAPFMSDFHAFFFEFVVTAAFAFVVVATAGDRKSKLVHLAPIPIGFALGIGVWAANAFTGGSLNPARSLGPAVWSGRWNSHWVYWAGPLGGALVAALVYRIVLQGTTAAESPQAEKEKQQQAGPANEPQDVEKA